LRRCGIIRYAPSVTPCDFKVDFAKLLGDTGDVAHAEDGDLVAGDFDELDYFV
jgi:hypothetical protein